VAACLLCLLGIIGTIYYHKVISRVAFVLGFIFIFVLFLYIGGFQLPITLMTSDLCEDFQGGVVQYIPSDKDYIHYYLLCAGTDPFAPFTTKAEQWLDRLKNETNPSDKTKQEIASLETMLTALQNMTCNSNSTEFAMNGLYTYENYLLCTNFINDLSITSLGMIGIGIFAFIMVFIGFKIHYDYDYNLLPEELGLFR